MQLFLGLIFILLDCEIENGSMVIGLLPVFLMVKDTGQGSTVFTATSSAVVPAAADFCVTAGVRSRVYGCTVKVTTMPPSIHAFVSHLMAAVTSASW